MWDLIYFNKNIGIPILAIKKDDYQINNRLEIYIKYTYKHCYKSKQRL